MADTNSAAPIPQAVVSESNGEVSCSVAETNRIRIALGMRPLDETEGGGAAGGRQQQKAAAAEARASAEKAAAAAETAARLQRARERRALHAKEKGKTLGQQLAAKGDTKLSAAEWVAYVALWCVRALLSWWHATMSRDYPWVLQLYPDLRAALFVRSMCFP